MSDPSTIHITAEITPNPNTMRFVINKNFLETGTVDFPDEKKAQESALASRLFKNKQVVGVMVGNNFITITKQPDVEWEPLVPVLVSELRAGLLAGETVVPAALKTEKPSPTESNDPISQKIKEILNKDIRPAVAMDGGDITFMGYADGVVTLHLQGSCSSCPSSVMTLRMGVENRLKAEIPEIKEVVQI